MTACPCCGYRPEGYVIVTGTARGTHYAARIEFAEVLAIVTDGWRNTVIITRERGEFLSEESIRKHQSRMPHMLRVSRSAMIDPSAFLSLEGATIRLKGTAQAPKASRRYLPEVRRKLIREAA